MGRVDDGRRVRARLVNRRRDIPSRTRTRKAMFDRGPILVSSTATRDQAERHVLVRAAVADRIETHELFDQLRTSWRDDELHAIATNTHGHFVDLATVSAIEPDDLVFLPGGSSRHCSRDVTRSTTPDPRRARR
jgi:hypothetical protein